MDEASIPFDEFEHGDTAVPAGPRHVISRWLVTGLRLISFLALWTAIITAAFLLLNHGIASMTGRALPFTIKSAVPLIAIGLSYLTLVLTLRRTAGQLLVGVLMGLAFMLWGSEQFLTGRALITFIDDCIVFLFVTDLSIVIRHNFRECKNRPPVRPKAP